MHHNQRENSIQQDRTGEYPSIQASLGNKSLGFLYSKADESGKTVPTAEVVEVNGKIQIVPIAVVYNRQVSITPRRGFQRNFTLQIGSQRTYVTTDELEAITTLLARNDSDVDINHAVKEAKRRVPDYPWTLNTASEAVWALGESLSGVKAANKDLHKMLAELRGK